MSLKIYKENSISKFFSVIVGIYILLIGLGVPLAVRDYYFDILIFKYYFYCVCTITMIVSLTFGFIFISFKSNKFSKNETINKSSNFECNIVDLFIALYWLTALISTLSSDYVYESFWGNEGRFTGLFLITLYVLSYFCISRFWKFRSWYLDLILAVGIIVSLFGITDYFKLDIFRFKVLMQPEQRSIFTSTIGNINTYTAYVGIIAGIASVLFATEKNKLKMIWYYICLIISFFAIIMGVSDNAYLSLAALFGFLPIYLFKDKTGLKKYVIIIASFLTVVQFIDWINTFMKDKVLGVDSAFNILIKFKRLHYLVIALWLIVFILYFCDRISKITRRYNKNIMIYGWLSFIGIILTGMVFVLYDCNIAGNANRYSSLSNYLLFNDDWGTHRGYIWRNAIESFMNFSFLKKLVGYGPETFGILLLNKTANNPFKEIFDSAHNEYLHTLITVGIMGLSSYIAALIFFVRNCLKKHRSNPYLAAIAFGAICYSAQALVNINLPIVTPILWLLLGMGSAHTFNELDN